MTVMEVEKANPLWDGDGVQGAGQPRNRRGEWTGTGRFKFRISATNPHTGETAKRDSDTEYKYVVFNSGGNSFHTSREHAVARSKKNNGVSDIVSTTVLGAISQSNDKRDAPKGPKCPYCGKRASEFAPQKPGDHMREHQLNGDVISKANPLWDGDGVQGAGQPRDRHGRWVGLPGPTSLSRIGSFDLADGSIGVFTDDERRPMKTYKGRGAKNRANKLVAEKIAEDAKAYQNNRRSVQRANRKMREESARRQEQKAQAEQERAAEQALREKNRRKVFGDKEIKGPKPKGVPQKGPVESREKSRISASPIERLPNPGRPTQAQANDASRWARQNMPDAEAQYAGLIVRLLKNRGVTQDPSLRHQMSERYGVPAGRLVQIEQEVYDHMFPPKVKAAAQRKKDLRRGVSALSPNQERNMLKLGARSSTPDIDSTDRPKRIFKILKGPSRGRWAEVGWGGEVTLMTKRDAERRVRASKVEWTKRLLAKKETMLKARNKYKAEQAALGEGGADEVKVNRERKIKAAIAWAVDNGLDPSDSYWWAFFNNDASLLKAQKEESRVRMEVGLSEIMTREKMDPAILEGLLAMPDDVDSRDMRGHKPRPNKSLPGDDDFEEASALSREVSPEHEDKLATTRREHERRIKAAYERYKKKHPGSKISLEAFKDDYYNNKLRIPGGARVRKARKPLWEGDGYQAPGQPRNRRGEFSRTGGALSRIAGAAGALSGVFDDRRKSVHPHVKLPLQKGRVHQAVGANGKRLASKDIDPRKALYARNNGSTKISDARIAAIHADRSVATQQERDLLLSARPYESIDGGNLIRIQVKRKGGGTNKRARYSIIGDIIKEMVNDEKRNDPNAVRGARGHVIAREDIDQSKRDAENRKRVDNDRNKLKRSDLEQLLDDFGDQGKAKCIFCGRPVNIETISPEKMMPGGQKQSLGGKYERGNMAPAHVKCNNRHGTFAQHKPDEYYDFMLENFMKRYDEWIQQGYLKNVISKHRARLKKLGLI